MNRPAAGTLRIFGRALAEASEEEQVNWRRRIGFVFENGGRLLGHLPVAENVALPMRYHLDIDEAQMGQRVEELLKRTGTLSYARTMPSRLNIRLQQRVSLARALAVPTEMMFLDNSLGGLSPRDARWWTEYLRELRQSRVSGGAALTIVAACDDFHPWLDLATHFGVIDGERFRVLGGRDQVQASKDPVVSELL
jgi:ABC-type transporter Mla maintaining outer membrane lipid asymmetry ATPase subunit MlaF